MKAWIEHTQTQKRMKRLDAYSRNYTYRRNMRLLFSSWRGVTHSWFKERIDKEAEVLRQEKHEEHLAQWDHKVEALKLYLAQL